MRSSCFHVCRYTGLLLSEKVFVEAQNSFEGISFKMFYGDNFIEKISLHPNHKAELEPPLVLHVHLKFGAAKVMVCDEIDEADLG
ncbi:hypothetical protein SUGI_1121150 [Cryptomeria japonica]|nr:hypothetical protein SUGI_1121150 [Cryptomeria japonica]